MTKAAQHRRNLVLAAIRLFREKGYAATGLSEILATSGAPKGSLYYYFPEGKEQLAQEAVSQAGARVAATLETLAANAADPREFVDRYCDLLAGWMAESGFRAGCPITTTLLETVPDSAALTHACQAVFNRWQHIIAGVFEAAGHGTIDADERAGAVIAAIEGALIQARVQQSEKPLRQVTKVFQ